MKLRYVADTSKITVVPTSEGTRMRQPFRRPLTLLTTAAVIALTAMIWMAAGAQSTVRAMPAVSPQQSGSAAAPASSSGVFRQYCVGCHNERMKVNFGNLSLEGIDPTDVAGHAETLEKVVRKLRKGQMPPLATRRVDDAGLATIDAWILSLAP